jgi:hypothetical protein
MSSNIPLHSFHLFCLSFVIFKPGFKFNFRDPEDSNGGTIVIGGSDESLYEGEISWFNLSSATYWQITLDGLVIK